MVAPPCLTARAVVGVTTLPFWGAVNGLECPSLPSRTDVARAMEIAIRSGPGRRQGEPCGSAFCPSSRKSSSSRRPGRVGSAKARNTASTTRDQGSTSVTRQAMLIKPFAMASTLFTPGTRGEPGRAIWCAGRAQAGESALRACSRRSGRRSLRRGARRRRDHHSTRLGRSSRDHQRGASSNPLEPVASWACPGSTIFPTRAQRWLLRPKLPVAEMMPR